MKKFVLGAMVISVSLFIVINSGLPVKGQTSEDHPCTHPGSDTCPGEETSKYLHCISCTHPEHAAGCLCTMDYPCGTSYPENAYCTPYKNY